MSTGGTRALTAAFSLVLGTTASLPAAPAAARAPACPPRSPQPAAAPSAIPWPQQRYRSANVHALADGRGVTVAVIDSGIDPSHPQLRGAVTAGADLLDGGAAPIDCVGHGTAVASVIAARPLDGVGFQGLAPGSTVMSLRVSELVELDDGNTAGRRGSAAGLAAAIRTAVDRRAGVVNLSLVTYRDDPAVRDAVAYAVRRDVVVVAAAGNRHESGNPTPYPAAYDGVLGVGAIGPDGRRLSGSQVGPYVDLVAPGGQVVVAGLPQGHTLGSGTSFAVPFVAAAAALLRQYRPGLSAAEVAERLTATADGPAGGTGYGAGVLNPYRALTEQVGGVDRTAAAAIPTGPRPPDARARQRAADRERALELTATGVLACLVLLLGALVLPRGVRRRWRPGLRRVPSATDLPEIDRSTPAFGEDTDP